MRKLPRQMGKPRLCHSHLAREKCLAHLTACLVLVPRKNHTFSPQTLGPSTTRLPVPLQPQTRLQEDSATGYAGVGLTLNLEVSSSFNPELTCCSLPGRDRLEERHKRRREQHRQRREARHERLLSRLAGNFSASSPETILIRQRLSNPFFRSTMSRSSGSSEWPEFAY